MKKIVFIFLPAITIYFVSCKNTGLSTPVVPAISVLPSADNSDAPPPGTPVLETPQQYNNYIVQRLEKMRLYLHQINEDAKIIPANSNNEMDELLPKMNQLTREIKAMPPYKGSDALQNAAVALFEFYETTYDQKYNQAVIYSKGSTVSNARLIKADELSVTEKKLDAALQVQQQIFADNNHFVLTSTILQPRVDYLN